MLKCGSFVGLMIDSYTLLKNMVFRSVEDKTKETKTGRKMKTLISSENNTDSVKAIVWW